jgi:hypothetical protein
MSWRSLFDGSTLDGWHAVPRVPTLLRYAATLEDFLAMPSRCTTTTCPPPALSAPTSGPSARIVGVPRPCRWRDIRIREIDSRRPATIREETS